ncbi:hypothetical protein DL239_13390 [Sedimentitalea sp. CY04]|uniref:Co-chaperone DjlA N-terminal domain-containing protein n=1 Tax=Parasedimentitalea denitrificans TaxID=2211118 RepID=A0ABX0WB13_9RHOB|nr:TerB family tellurite resistance protein [Sedimentitalea sp. CY04]NIZ61969.1 hypothetical protein [Sedimentitalea sp. CY04]
MTHTIEEQMHSFDAVKGVVSNDLLFKSKLGIGADAYASLRTGKMLQQLWDVGGVAATGAGVAASTTVASTFFGSFLTAAGLVTAVTPIGWVVGAAAATGGVYYGVTRLFHSYSETRVEEIPKFINTPIDVLGAALLDLLGSLALKVAAIDGVIDPSERQAMRSHFVDAWGYDAAYVASALNVLEENIERTRLADMTASLAEFALANPDCNFTAIQSQIATLLEEIAAADGILDEREEMAIEKILNSLREQNSTLSSLKRTITSPVKGASSALGWVAGKFRST